MVSMFDCRVCSATLVVKDFVAAHLSISVAETCRLFAVFRTNSFIQTDTAKGGLPYGRRRSSRFYSSPSLALIP